MDATEKKINADSEYQVRLAIRDCQNFYFLLFLRIKSETNQYSVLVGI